MNIVTLTPQYIPNPERSRAVSGAKIFVGEPDLDPEIVANQKQISVLQESGGFVNVAQPVLTGAGGVPLYNGSYVSLYVDGEYSMKVLDSLDAEIYYIPNVLDGNRLVATQAEVLAAVDNAKVITPLNLSYRVATETFTGLSAIATEAETVAAINDLKYVTPFKLSKKVASSAEVLAGTNDNQFVTPLKLQEKIDALPVDLDEFMIVADQKPLGTAGGTFTPGARRTRDLNTVKYNSIIGASLAANRITLPAGDYRITASAPAYDVSHHQAWLVNITALSDISIGTSKYTSPTGDVNNNSDINDAFTLSATSDLEIQHRCFSQAATANLGFGNPSSFDIEEYTGVIIWKL